MTFDETDARLNELLAKYSKQNHEHSKRGITAFTANKELSNNTYMIIMADDNEIVYFDRKFNVCKYNIETKQNSIIEQF